MNSVGVVPPVNGATIPEPPRLSAATADYGCPYVTDGCPPGFTFLALVTASDDVTVRLTLRGEKSWPRDAAPLLSLPTAKGLRGLLFDPGVVSSRYRRQVRSGPQDAVMVLRAAARPPGYQDMSVLEHNEAETSPPIGASYERDRAEKFTVDEAVSSIGFGWFQVRLSLMMGFSWVGESMEVMLLSVLSPALHCAWQLSSWKQAFLTTGVFLGMMFGAMFWGWFSDKYGRKKALVTSGWFLFYFGLLSAFSPTYTWLLLLRSTMGFFIGALAQAVTLYSEFLPTKQRGSCILFLNMFWALGSALEVVLALLLMPELGWRWLLALSSVPLLMFVLFSPLIPESVRFHGACGRPDLARAAIDKMAAANGRPAPRGQLTIDDTSSERRGHVWELLSPKLWWTTLLLWCIWEA
ncbi:synaptic vesicle 2-related protein-like [Pollicipes pollicipes]|uniref:synaptic vesicle 2-related protein-like n=1 Tax=Pollicipes pollicipes TaxID=41117 RepID=UPI0018858525|nr:synaptic vesicle 2-related protein-like [Pollicipes pollicipes]